jgi:N-methylhydantoinase A/oxoprolinase/acetone carboxylase beta subunit
VIDEACSSMRAEARGALADVGVSDANAQLSLAIEARFAGQAHSLALDVTETDLRDANRLREAFRDKYRQAYGDCPSRADVEITAVRLQLLRPAGVTGHVSREAAGATRRPVARKAYFPETGEAVTPVHDREALAAGDRIEGPAIVEERDSTLVVPPGAVLEVDASGNLLVDLTGMELTA